MNCHNIILNYIQNCEKNEPIFIDDIKEYIMQFYKEEEKEKIYNNVKEILNRLNKANIIKTAYKGIYYIPKTNIFGEVPLANSKIIRYKYLVDKFGNIKGYITGATLFNKAGLTTQVPNVIEIVTNECKNNNKYENKYLNVAIRKPKIKINNDNIYFYTVVENYDEIFTKDYNFRNNNCNDPFWKSIDFDMQRTFKTNFTYNESYKSYELDELIKQSSIQYADYCTNKNILDF